MWSGRKSGDIVAGWRALPAGDHGADKVFPMVKRRQKNPADMKEHEEKRQIGQHLMQILRRASFKKSGNRA